MALTINVTAAHIRDAKGARDTDHYDTCAQYPVARAFHDLGGDYIDTNVNHTHAHITRSLTTYWSCKLPPEVQQFILDFDAERPVQPFSFTI